MYEKNKGKNNFDMFWHNMFASNVKKCVSSFTI